MKTPPVFPRWLTWAMYAAVLMTAPLLFNGGAEISLLCQMGTFILLGLSYNMLLGQGGMLSFGHAVYAGLGAFCSMHVLNMATNGLPVPVSLIPLVGGVAGMLFGVLFGYVTTRKSGTTFAMITLGIAELVFASALMFPGFFGGEGGIMGDRVVGQPFLGISFGPQIEVYYLIAAWLFVCTLAMYGFTRTPLGRILNAVRDNTERAEFIGYDARLVRYLTLILSAFFAGIAGGLTAINFEIVSAENVGTLRSGAILLFTFIGGIGFFFGPIIGAIVGVFMTVSLSSFTHAWQLYLGLFFIVIVMCFPGGIAGLLMQALPSRRDQCGWQLVGCVVAGLLTGMSLLAGIVLMVEMLYFLHLGTPGSATVTMHLLIWEINPRNALPWLSALMLLATGVMGWWMLRRHLHMVSNKAPCVVRGQP
ncbi:hypothetical protein GCM10008066_08230 [Oxalicibacterium faecigallinarum]|uniref:Branched-chain amino acid ABC transporter permease n=2 Tax=Oxalicibacterium faecigallinarum TaxID=573741 RepID=A0A8J3ANU1_9BURK|nr:hypothetical protein GCM10008066_08230 [Oxalicibacterium faecigallinarum]